MDRFAAILAGKSTHEKTDVARREEDTDDEMPEASREPEPAAVEEADTDAKATAKEVKAPAKAPAKAAAKAAAKATVKAAAKAEPNKTSVKKLPPKKLAAGAAKKVLRKPEDGRTALERTSDSNFSKRAVLAGVTRIQGKKRLFNRCRHLVKGMVEEVMQPAKVLLQYYKKRTLTAHMVVHIASSKGHKLYWCSDAPKKPTKPAASKTAKV